MTKVRKLPLILLVLLSSVLFPLALPNEVLPFGNAALGFVALAPLFAAVVLAPSYGFASVLGMIFGGISTLLTSYWFVFFQDYSVWTLGGVTLAYVGFNAMLFPYLRAFGRARPTIRPLLLAMAWTAYEYFKSVGFLAYPWGLAAYPVGGILPLIQVADVTGVYGVSFLMAFANALVADWALSGRSVGMPRRALAALALFWAVLMAAALGYGAFHLASPIQPERYARFLLVQQNMDPWDPRGSGKVLKTNQDLTLQGIAHAGGPVDLAVWTESSMYSPYVINGNEWNPPENALVPYAAKAGVHHLIGGVVVLNWPQFVASGYRTEMAQQMNSAIFMGPEGQVLDTYGKIHPVPFAEAVPFFDVPFVYRFFADVLNLRYMWTMGTRRTIFRLPLSGGGEVSFASPICFEDAFADLCSEFVRSGADLLVNITNDSWSKQASSETQHFVAARWRAVENRRVLVRSANGGVSAVIGPLGEVRDMLPLFQSTAKAVEVPVYKESSLTFYTRWGDWLPAAFLVLLFLVIVAGLLPWRRSGIGGIS